MCDECKGLGHRAATEERERSRTRHQDGGCFEVEREVEPATPKWLQKCRAKMWLVPWLVPWIVCELILMSIVGALILVSIMSPEFAATKAVAIFVTGFFVFDRLFWKR